VTVRTSAAVAELPAGWDDLSGPDDLFLTTRWLRVVEATHRTRPAYLWLERDGAPVAGLATILATADAPWVSGRPDTLLAKCVAAGMPGAAEFAASLPAGVPMPSLALGGRHIGNTRLLLGPTATSGDAARLLDAALMMAAGAEARSVVVPYLDQGDSGFADDLRGRGFRSFDSGRYSRLAVPAGGFDGYLRTLPSRRRVSVAAERRRIAEAGAVVTLGPLAEADPVTLGALETELLGKYGIDWDAGHAARVLEVVAGEFGDDARVAVATVGGVVRGFVLYLCHGAQWYVRQAGFDYAFQHESRLPLYFELAYYRLIEEASAHGVITLHYGLGSEDTKRRRGAVATTQRCWIRLETTGDDRR
jgi:predicted N-acyltransferase